MSHISSSHSDNQQVREHYRERENRLRERQSEELKRISQAHQEEINDLRAESHGHINDVRSQSAEQLREEDLRHQNEINQLSQDHYRSQRAKDLEHERWEQAQLRDFRNINQRQDDRFRSQAESQQTKHAYSQQRLIDQNQRTLDSYRQRHLDQVNQISTDLRDEYEERSALQSDRHYNQRADLINEQQRYRLYTDNKIDQLERKHRYDLGRQQALHESQRQSQEKEFATQYEDMRDEARYSHKLTQDRYNKALEEERSRVDDTQEKLFGAKGRAERERDRLIGKIRDLEKQNVKDRSRIERQKKRELRNLQIAHQNTLDTLYKERKKMVEEYNRINSSEIANAYAKADKRMTDNYHSFKDKMERNDDKYNRDLAIMRNKLITENNSRIEKNKLRNEAVKNENLREQNRLREMHANQVQRLKDHHFNILDNERYQNNRNRQRTNHHLSNTVKDLDNDYHRKLADVENQHRTEMNALRNRHQREMGEKLQEQKRILVETQRAAQSLADNREQKYQYTIKKIREGHKAELETLNAQYKKNIRDLMRGRDREVVSREGSAHFHGYRQGKARAY